MSDRTVHAHAPGMELVRYERAGKWYLEPTRFEEPVRNRQRQSVTLSQAVVFALWAWRNDGAPIFDLPGGGAFDAKLRAAASREGQA